jgi:hypothetical protein
MGWFARGMKTRVDRHGLVILSGWIVGVAERVTREDRKRLVHQRVLATVLEPPHLPQDGRGMKPFAPRQLP